MEFERFVKRMHGIFCYVFMNIFSNRLLGIYIDLPVFFRHQLTITNLRIREHCRISRTHNYLQKYSIKKVRIRENWPKPC